MVKSSCASIGVSGGCSIYGDLTLRQHPVAIRVLLLLVCAGCDGTQTQPGMQVAELAAHCSSVTFESPWDVKNVVAIAAAAERAVIFVHVDWAMMEPQQTRYAEFVLEYQQAHPGDDLQFYYIDCTPVTSGYEPLRALEGWAELEEEAGGGSLIHGWGELVWMERGRALRVQRILAFASASELVEASEVLLP